MAQLNGKTGDMDEDRYIDVVFDAAPGPDAGRFVEVENQRRRSVNCGEWVQRPDGFWVLRINSADIERATQ